MALANPPILDSDLTDIGGLVPVANHIMVGDGSHWQLKSPSQARTSLGLAIGSDIQAYDPNFVKNTGLSSSNAIPRFDSTSGKFVKNSGIFIDDSNNITGITGLSADVSVAIGKVGASSGVLELIGETSGKVSVKSQPAAGTYNFNLPITAGIAGQPLVSSGGGANAMAWGNTIGVTSTTTSGGTTTLTSDSTKTQIFTGSSNHTVVLPDATTMMVGEEFEIVRATTGGLLTVNNAASGLLVSMNISLYYVRLVLTNNSTPAGTWNSSIRAVSTNTPNTTVARDSAGNFSANAIFCAAYLSGASNPPKAGLYRLSNAEVITWRNNANTADLNLSKNTSDVLNWVRTMTLGAAGSTTGALGLIGSTSGNVTIQPQAAAGTYNFNLPTSAGSSGDVLVSGGGGSNPMTWSSSPTFANGAALGTGNATIKCKIVQINNWNMFTTASVAVPHGLTHSTIRSVHVVVRRDDDTIYSPLYYSASKTDLGGAAYWDSTNIYLERLAGGEYANSNYDSTSFNRGFVIIFYV